MKKNKKNSQISKNVQLTWKDDTEQGCSNLLKCFNLILKSLFQQIIENVVYDIIKSICKKNSSFHNSKLFLRVLKDQK